jgi:hypothetical protein
VLLGLLPSYWFGEGVYACVRRECAWCVNIFAHTYVEWVLLCSFQQHLSSAVERGALVKLLSILHFCVYITTSCTFLPNMII